MITNACDSITIRQSKEKYPYDGIIKIKWNIYLPLFRFEIEDNGTGIKPEIEPYLFSHIPDTDMPEELKKKNIKSALDLSGGRGLGLSVIYNMVGRKDCNIGYTNKGESKGAIFWYEHQLKSL